MKHDLIITLILISLFLTSHVVGLFIVKYYLPENKTLPLGIEKPQLDEKTSYIQIIVSLIFATILALILIKFKAIVIWKFWFFLSVMLALVLAFGAFLPEIIALILALILTILKVFYPNFFTQNFTEIFIYGGIAGIFVPVLGISSVIILLLIISVYDMIAVWKTKHMIKMAKFQAKSKMFAGIFVPYKQKDLATTNKVNIKKTKTIHRQAILGGGDIAFPLLFSGVILKIFGFIPALIASLSAAVALFLLFLFADKKKFYPAMPFVTLGCLVGYFIVYLLF